MSLCFGMVIAATLGFPFAGMAEHPTTTIRWQSVDDATPQTGVLTHLTAEAANFRVESRETIHVPTKDLWWMTPVDATLVQEASATETVSDQRPAYQIVLTNNDRLSAQTVLIADDQLIATCHIARVEVQIPLEFVDRLVRVSASDSISELALDQQPRLTDVAILDNGDRLAGELIELSERHGRFRTALGETSIPRSAIAGLGFDQRLTTVPDRKPQRTRVIGLEDSLLTGTGVVWQNNHFSLTHEAGFAIELVPGQIARLVFSGERVTPLTDLPRPDFEFRPYLTHLTQTVDYRIDRNVRRGLLRLAGQPAGFGIGTTSFSRLTYSVPQGSRFFHATVGIDDITDGEGSVEFLVQGDGRELWRSGVRRGTDAPLDTGHLALDGVRELSLIVDFADFGDIQDVANWCRPVLLR